MLTIRRLGTLALVIGFAQVVFGAIVRITGSGLGCGDHWPDCYGSFTPAHSGSTLLVEISHRYGAAALSLAILALVVVALRKRNEPGVSGRGGVLRPSLLAILLVVVAALFGAVTVKLALNPIVVVTHLAIAMALLAVLVVVVVRAGGLGARNVPVRYDRTVRSGRAAAGLTFLALVFGALTANTPGAAVACQGFPWCRAIAESGPPLYIQVTHRIIAFLLLGHLIGITIGVRKRREAPAISRAAWTALGIVIVQVLVAAAMVEMALPPALRSIHQAVGTALWICVVSITALAAGAPGVTDIERIVYESPSRGEFATPEGVST
ncbi:MAG TPA: COX15/CtaA family protein [Gemmatimonadaceae bacterium]|nr:COX15/CtaA family protein [Gemmatimonadaceae bacterium]